MGDIAIFSMRKSLPVFDGGALRINGKGHLESKANDQRRYALKEYIYLAQRFIEFLTFNILKINIYSSYFDYLRNRIQQGLNIFVKKRGVKKLIERRPSRSLKIYLQSGSYLDEVISTRRSNYLAMQKLFADYANDLFLKGYLEMLCHIILF